MRHRVGVSFWLLFVLIKVSFIHSVVWSSLIRWGLGVAPMCRGVGWNLGRNSHAWCGSHLLSCKADALAAILDTVCLFIEFEGLIVLGSHGLDRRSSVVVFVFIGRRFIIDTSSNIHMTGQAVCIWRKWKSALLLVRTLQWLLEKTGSLFILISVVSRWLCWRILNFSALLGSVWISCELTWKAIWAGHHAIEPGLLLVTSSLVKRLRFLLRKLILREFFFCCKVFFSRFWGCSGKFVEPTLTDAILWVFLLGAGDTLVIWLA